MSPAETLNAIEARQEQAAILARSCPEQYDPSSEFYDRCFADLSHAIEAATTLALAGNTAEVIQRRRPPAGAVWCAPWRLIGGSVEVDPSHIERTVARFLPIT